MKATLATAATMATLILLPSLASADSNIINLMPKVTMGSSATLTFPTDTDPTCIKEIQQSTGLGKACQAGGCPVSSGMTIQFSQCSAVSLTFQAGTGCANTQAELFLSPTGSTYDVSLVNGYNKSVSIKGGGTAISVNNAYVRNVKGVYPFGCSLCTSRTSKDCTPPDAAKHKCSSSAMCQITNDTGKHYIVTFGG